MIHPIEWRYGRKEVRKIFDQETRLEKMLCVEAALAEALAEVGKIPCDAAEAIRKATEQVRLQEIQEVEKRMKHDVMAMVEVLAAKAGEAGKYVHLGATSNDVLDTATALQLKEFCELFEQNLKRLLSTLLDLAERTKRLVCVGRTHGQHAVPTTYGMKFASFACEVGRHLERLEQCKGRLLVGKVGGAVGTQAAYGKDGLKIQRIVLNKLGLGLPEVETQVVQRDRYAELIALLALIAQTMSRICTEIRNLQRTEISEVSEGFAPEQVGSSTMPHKRNPILCERVCGLSRVVKSLVIAAMDNIPLWHERDLTNSACERVILPEACILTDYLVWLTNDVLSGLSINEAAVRRNLELSRGLIMSEAVMLRLVEKGVPRQEAHEVLRECSARALREGLSFKETLLAEERLRGLLTEGEVEELLRPEGYLGTAIQQVEGAVERLRRRFLS